MIEIILFICALAIVVPILLFSSLVYNANRTLKGQKPVSTEEAIKIAFASSVKKARQIVSFLLQRTNQKVSEYKEKKNIDDAEYTEVKN